MAEKTRRETAKMDIETKHAEQLQKLNEFEQGLNPVLNDVAMKAAQDSRQFLLQNHKLMTSGFKSVDDTKLVKQRVMDTWTNVNSALKTFNENDKRLSELDGKGNEATRKVIADQLNLKNKKLYHDPNTGSGYWVNVDENGDIDMNTILPVKAMNTIQHQEFETFDVNAESEKATEKVADITTFITSTQDLTDPRLSGVYKQWIENETKSALSNDQKKASILMDYLGLEYSVDGKPSKRPVTYQRVKEYNKDGSMVMEDVTVDIGDVEITLNKETGELEPKLSPEQIKLAEDAYKAAIDIKLGRKATKQYVAPISGDVKTNANVASLVQDFVTKGDFSALQSALSQKNYTGTVAPDANGIIKLRNQKGNLVDVHTKGKTAKQVGKEIAGHLGVGTEFDQRSVPGNLSPAVLDPNNAGNFGIFSTQATTITDANVQFIEVSKGNERDLKSAVQTAAKEVGISAGRITVLNGEILLDGNKIGNVGVSTGPEIAQQLEQAAQTTTTQKKSTIIKGNVR
jgi:hypothetical protein